MSAFLKKELRTFAETTSVRGVQRAFRSVDAVLRVVWIAAPVASISVTVWQLERVLPLRDDDRETALPPFRA